MPVARGREKRREKAVSRRKPSSGRSAAARSALSMESQAMGVVSRGCGGIANGGGQ